MDFLIRKKFFVSLIIVLVLLNIASLVMVWMLSSNKEEPALHPGRDQGNKEAMDFIQSELGLDSIQQVQLAELRDIHFIERRNADKSILDLRREIIRETLKPNPDTVTMNKLAAMIGEIQEELELLIFDHFKGIKSVLKPEQVKQFDKLMNEMIEKNPPPPHDGNEMRQPPGEKQNNELKRINEDRKLRPPPPRDDERRPPPPEGRPKPPPREGGNEKPLSQSNS